MEGVANTPLERVLSYGMTGPFAGAAGFDYDVRKAEPYFAYDKVKFDVPTRSEGDNWCRYECR